MTLSGALQHPSGVILPARKRRFFRQPSFHPPIVAHAYSTPRLCRSNGPPKFRCAGPPRCFTVVCLSGVSFSYARLPPQIEFPGFGRQVFPEAVMLLFTHDLESGLLVDVSRCLKIALRP